MEKFKLKLDARQGKHKANQLRRQGKIPGTLYGPGVASKSVEVDEREFSRLPAAAYSHIVDLVGGEEGSVSALIRNVQRKHTTHEVLNIEFYRVAADRKLTVTVPLKIVGTSPAIGLGGVLTRNYDEAEVECFPADIPDFIEVNIATIVELDTGIYFGDLKVSDKIKILNPHEEVVVRVVTPRAEKEEEAPAAAAAAEGAAAPAEGAAAPAAGAKPGAAAPAAGKPGAAPAAGKPAPAADKKA
jgi:large subunit ribosomal protein L25